jgi:hypothetical protein
LGPTTMSHPLHHQHTSETLQMINNRCSHELQYTWQFCITYIHKTLLTNFYFAWIKFGRHIIILLHNFPHFQHTKIQDDCECPNLQRTSSPKRRR